MKDTSINVRIVSSETIKPSSPTAPHNRIHKLSCMDQNSPPGYMPTFFFYGPNHEPKPTSQNDVVDKLRSTLSKTLTHYYPFAGRYADDGGAFSSIECNDRGVTFAVAHVSGHMSSVLDAPDEDRLVQLLPSRRPQEKCLDDGGELILLMIRVNFFDCGGIAVAASAWHGVADVSSLSCFLQSWAAICRGDPAVDDLLKGSAVVDYSSLFPSQDLPPRPPPPPAVEGDKETNVKPPAVVAKRFVFPGSKIAELREKIGCFRGRQRTRVEAMSSLMWAAAIRVAREKGREKVTTAEGEVGFHHHSAVMVVNLRTRTSPPLPAMCMGNLIQLTEVVTWPVDDVAVMGELAGKLSGAVRTINHEYLKKLHEKNSEGYFELLRSFQEEYAKEDFIMISSSCRYPTYGADFGWGKPVSVNGFAPSNKMVVLLDAKDGEGIEAWVTLNEDDMSIFEKDSDLLYYAS